MSFVCYLADVYLAMAAVDESSNVIGGTDGFSVTSGTLETAPGIVGDAMKFDGQAWVQHPGRRDSCFWLPDLCPQGFTLSVWFCISEMPTGKKGGYILSNGGNTGDSYGVAIHVKTDLSVRVLVRTKYKVYWSAVPGTQLLNWYHLVSLWDDSLETTWSKWWL